MNIQFSVSVLRKVLLKNYTFTNRTLKHAIVNYNKLLDMKSETKPNKYLDVSTEDLSGITAYFPYSFNLAAYVNTSETLQKLLHLNVKLHKLEKNPYLTEKLLKLDFEKDMKEVILFLNNFVNMNEIGDYITKNPMILCEDVDNFKVRINYLQSKYFNHCQIKEIICRNPFWLMYSTIRIDKRLGYFQNKFSLNGNEVRSLATRQPKLITYNLHHITTNSFVIKEEMGFSDEEIKKLVLQQPKLWMINQRALLERFNYFHNVIKIPHEILIKYPNSLLCRNFKVKQRHQFLCRLGRAQYNPQKENFVPIMALVEDTDVEFCKKYAKCNIENYNAFLKTL